MLSIGLRASAAPADDLAVKLAAPLMPPTRPPSIAASRRLLIGAAVLIAMLASGIAPVEAAAAWAPTTTTTTPTATPAPLTTTPTTPAAPDESTAYPPMPPIGGSSALSGGRTTQDWGAVNGVDTSKWQHPDGAPIDWVALRNNGISFAFTKATEGPSITDPWFSVDYAAAGAAGLYRSAYSFARPTLPISNAAVDARYFVSKAGTFGGRHDLPPVLDLEQNGGLSAQDLTAWTALWLDTVTSLTGRRPIIYTGYYFWRDNLANTSRFGSSPLWYARYTPGATQPGPLFGGWSAWTFWQWTSSGVLGGIPGGAKVDIDKFGGTMAQLAAMAGPGRPVVNTGPVTSRNADGRLETFTVAPDGSVLHIWQLRPNGGWSGWSGLSFGRLAGSVTVATNADGRLEVFGVTDTGDPVHAWQVVPNGDWSAWMPLGGTLTGSTTGVAANPDGRLEVFGRAPDGSVIHNWQVAPNSGWAGWWSLGGSTTGPPTVANGEDGRIDVFTRNADDSVGHLHQHEIGGWADWENLGGNAVGPVAVTVDASGAFAIAYPMGTGVALTQQAASDAPFPTAATIATVVPGSGSTVGIAANADGRLETFAVDVYGTIGHAWAATSAVSSSWSGWVHLGAGATGTPTVARNADGRLEIFAATASGAVVHAWQTPTSPSGWSGVVGL